MVVSLTKAVNHPIKLTKPSGGVMDWCLMGTGGGAKLSLMMDGPFFGHTGQLKWGNMRFIDADEAFYVPELAAFKSILTIEGKLLARWSSPAGTGARDGGHAVWVDSHGDLYVNQNLEGHRLLKYRTCA